MKKSKFHSHSRLPSDNLMTWIVRLGSIRHHKIIGQMTGQMTWRTTGRMTGRITRMDSWMDNWADNRVDNWADNRADNWVDNWADKQMQKEIYIFIKNCFFFIKKDIKENEPR